MAHANVLSLFEGVRVVAVCDPAPAARERASTRMELEAAYADYDRFLEHNLDIVVVASPPMQHAEQSIAALRAGKHVLCEVPMIYSLDFDEAQRQAQALADAVVAAEGSTGARFMFAENTNYWWFVHDWQRRIDQGELGRIIYAEVEYVHNCRSIMAHGDGTLTWRASMPPIFYCTHSLGPILALAGSRPVRVVGHATGTETDPRFPAPDMEVAIVTLENGALVKVLCGFKVAREPSHHYFSLYGTRGSVETVRNQPRAVGHFTDGDVQRMSDIPFSYDHPNAPDGAGAGGHGTCEYYMIADFLNALRADEPMPIDVFAGLDMTMPGVFAHESARRCGVPMDVPDYRAARRR